MAGFLRLISRMPRKVFTGPRDVHERIRTDTSDTLRGRSDVLGEFNPTDYHDGTQLPPADWQPYPLSSFYRPIVGTENGGIGTPSVHPNNADIIKRVAGTTAARRNPSQSLVGADTSTAPGPPFPSGAHPMYYANESDPQFTVLRHSLSGANFGSNWYGVTIRIPQNARPGIGTDAHMGVVQPDGTEWFLYKCRADATGATLLNPLPPGGGDIYCGGLGKHDIYGDGLRLGTSGNATAAYWASLLGVLRLEEMQARVINHALFMGVAFVSGQIVQPALGPGAARALTLSGAHVFPMTEGTINYINMRNTASGAATQWETVHFPGAARLPDGSLVTYTGMTGTAASGTLTGCNGGNAQTLADASTLHEHYWPPTGARFQLAMTDAEIDAIPDVGNNSGRWWNKVLLKALRRYGGFVGDTGGGNFSFQKQHTFTWYALGQGDRWRTWAAAEGMLYDAVNDHYQWDMRTIIDWSSYLRILDWNDPDNR